MTNVDVINGSAFKNSGITALNHAYHTGTKTFPDRSQSSHIESLTEKPLPVASAPIMTGGCGICGKTSQVGVGGICGGCWSQFKENGVRIGNLEDFRQFTEAVSDQVSRIVTMNPENDALIEAVKEVVPKIFEGDNLKSTGLSLKKQVGGQGTYNLDGNIETMKIPCQTSCALDSNLAISNGVLNETSASMNEGPGEVDMYEKAPRSASSSDKNRTPQNESNMNDTDRPKKLTRSKTLAFSENSLKSDKEAQNNKQKITLRSKNESGIDSPKSTLVRAKTELNIKKSTAENETTPDNNTAKQTPKTFSRATTRISAVSQRQAKDKALRREKTMKVESSDNKVRYQPTTIMKESKEGEEKKSLGTASKPSTSSLKRMKSSIPYKRSKTEKNIVRRKQTANDNAITKHVTQNKIPSVSKREASDDEEDEDDDLGKQKFVPKYAPKEKLMVKGQNSSKTIEESANKVNRIAGSRLQKKPLSSVTPPPPPVTTNILSTMDKLQKYGVMGDENIPVTKTNTNAIVKPQHKDEEYFDQPPVSNRDQTIVQSIPSKLENNQQENCYFDDIKRNTCENKMLTETCNKKEEPSKNSTYFDKPISFIGATETSSESTDYTPNKLCLGRVFSRDLALASGESPLTTRKGSNYYENDYESGGIYHAAKNFSMGNGFRPFNDTFKNKPNSITFNGSLNQDDSFNSHSEDSSYTGGFYTNTSFSSEVSTIEESRNDKTFSYGQSYVGSENSTLAIENNDNDLYTGGVFKVSPTTVSSVVTRPLPEFSEPLMPSLSDITGTEELNNSLLSVAKRAITESIKNENTNDPVKQMNRLNKKRHSIKNVDFFIEKSIESAGDFFSKTIMSFRSPNFNNSSNDWFDNSTGPCGSTKHIQDRLQFSSNEKEYTDYESGTYRPAPLKPVQKAKKEVGLPNYQKYEGYNDCDCCSSKVKETRSNEHTEREPWYAGTDDDFYGPTNVTWDGRDWPGKTSLSNSLNGNQEFEQDSYQSSLLCEKYNMNNNYPDYNNKYQASNVKNERREPPPPPPRGNDDDYAPCSFSNCPGPRVSEQRPVRKEPPPKPKMQSMSYYFNPGAEATATYEDEPAEYAGYNPIEAKKQEIPSPPPVPKVIQVGHIVVRNNVENDFDYAENINRDIGTTEPIGSYGGNSDSYSDDYQTGIPDQTAFDHDRETLTLAKSVKKALAAAKNKNTCGNNSIANAELLTGPTPQIDGKSLAKQPRLVKGGPRELSRPELTKASPHVKKDNHMKTEPVETTGNQSGKGGSILTWPLRKLGIIGK